MRWKELLNVDLGYLLRGARQSSAAAEAPVYWWNRIGPMLNGIGRRLAAPAPPDDSPFPAAILRVAQDPAWRGPFYLNARCWRRDVILVAEQLRSLIACNAPLAPGLAAAAREDLRLRSRWLPRGTSTTVRVLIVIVLAALVGILLAMISSALGSQVPVLVATPILIIALFRALLQHESRYDRMAVFLALEHRIACGSPLSDAMGTLPRFFPRHLANLVEAGELAGELDSAFDQFNDEMLRSLGTQRQLRSVFWYLAFLFGAQLFIGAFLLVKVIPVFVEIRQEAFDYVGRDYSPAPQAGGLGGFLNALFPDLETLTALPQHVIPVAPALGGTFAALVLWRIFVRFRGRRNWATRGLGSALLFLPWFRGLVARHNLGQIALMLHGLLRAGVPLDRAIGMALGGDIHPAYQHWLAALRERVCQGESLKEALHTTASRRLIPDSFTGLIEAGERSGQLPETLARIAELYRRDTEKRLGLLQGLVLPVGILVLGYLVMATQVSVFRVLIELADSINV